MSFRRHDHASRTRYFSPSRARFFILHPFAFILLNATMTLHEHVHGTFPPHDHGFMVFKLPLPETRRIHYTATNFAPSLIHLNARRIEPIEETGTLSMTNLSSRNSLLPLRTSRDEDP